MKKCYWCGKLFHEDGLTRTADGYLLCEGCYEEQTFECHNCGKHHLMNGRFDQYGEEWCADCWDDLSDELGLKPPEDIDFEYENWRDEQLIESWAKE